ncbi:chorismate mutase [Sporosalibacterium faouarense]|uniref:chorismate mutase n=1 Tax=Sporosalibacterium faouarense TaxID=516123 RepID=UPI00141D3B53|nr:chorismate mutase [Sporosalibacterium faouarense]MTI47373.1 chorismate mutase [Bacillota bacterium]
MDDLEKLRREIDKIDEELVKNFEKRMEVVLRIGEYKKKNGLSVINKSREDDVIEKNINRLKNKELEEYLKEFIIELMDISKKLQSKKHN